MKKTIINIHGKPVIIKEVDPNEFDKTQYGASDTRKHIIYLSTEGTVEGKIQTILHEYLHFFEADFNESLEEEFIQKLAMSLYWFLTANGIKLGNLLGYQDDRKRI